MQSPAPRCDSAESCEYSQIGKILEYIGVDSLAPRISPARGPPPWEDGDALAGSPAPSRRGAPEITLTVEAFRVNAVNQRVRRRVFMRVDHCSTVPYWHSYG